ncbi:MAG TPA: phosphatase, partial [Candidatus Latescibacteria bacterium]|nr:phosphatase [Candidatus Latescibacterota bacterium]
MHLSRRHFLKSAAAVTLGFQGLQRHVAFATQNEGRSAGFGPLVEDPDGILSLPADFTYRILSRTGVEMADGLLMPGAHDAMAAFQGSGGRTLLVCNHELTSGALAAGAFGPENDRLSKVPANNFYDFGGGVSPSLGGTTTTVLGKDGQVERRFLSLAGTVRNCAGGPTPWGSWVTCEETTQRGGEAGYEKDHGYNFEVPATQDIRRADPIPLKAMGRFNHEAVAVDLPTRTLYLTEDSGSGRLYRFTSVGAKTSINGKEGLDLDNGLLEVLEIEGFEAGGYQEDLDVARKLHKVKWVAVQSPERTQAEVRSEIEATGVGAPGTVFKGGEGIWTQEFPEGQRQTVDGSDHPLRAVIFFACKGDNRVYALDVDNELIEVVFDNEQLTAVDELPYDDVDNLVVSPAGDVIVAEDGDAMRLMVMIPNQPAKILLQVPGGESELTG